MQVRMSQTHYGYFPKYIDYAGPNDDCQSGYWTDPSTFVVTGGITQSCDVVCPTRYAWYHEEIDISDGEYRYRRWNWDCDTYNGPYGPTVTQLTESAGFAASYAWALTDSYPSVTCNAFSCEDKDITYGVQTPPLTWYRQRRYYTDPFTPNSDDAYDYLMAFPFSSMPTGSDNYYNVDTMTLTMDCEGNVTTSSVIESAHFPLTSLSYTLWARGSTDLYSCDKHIDDNADAGYYLYAYHLKSALLISGSWCHIFENEEAGVATPKTCIEKLYYSGSTGISLLPRKKYPIWAVSRSFDSHTMYLSGSTFTPDCCTGSYAF